MKALIATSLGNIKVDNFEVPNKGNNILVKNGGIVFGSVYLAIYCLQLLVQYKILHAGKLPTPAFIGSPEF